MKRRTFLKFGGALVAQSVIASSLLDSVFLSTAHGQTVSIRDLKNSLPADQAMILVPQDAQFASYQQAFNKRTLKTPIVRVLCSTPQAVAISIQWAQANKVPLAVRSGGHSFEGLSQGTGLIIDTRPMSQFQISSDKQTFIAGAGALLGNVYTELAKDGRAVPAGSCPTVGITGHTLGGGYGLLARPLGLACDSLLKVEMVNAKGEIIQCSADENKDLFWALRGGGAGSFGIVTKLQFKTHEVSHVYTYGMSWKVSPEVAAQLMKTWQQWAPESPREITSLMKVSRGKDGLINVRALGQTVGTENILRSELARLSAIAQPESLNIKDLDFMSSVRHFGGSFDQEYIFMKGKSDYIKQVMSDEGIAVLLKKIPSGIDVIFDSYGGAIRDVADDATAFAHRTGTVSSLQYYTQWFKEADGKAKLETMKTFHDALRPYMSGAAYFNYCDLDIKDYARAYWGNNLQRLIDIKVQHDPNNFFAHAQSIPLKKGS
ncbi:FAD-binding oxidoreductase [Bdellovibrio svalbardensis]|uniref:FAD-binding oxidoreductase n=1 Tax=Bdellovibrio svalbardensis TaxID=2972972 RepID=A0ABT6DJQ6_9BACT|nr:FAD-binding oxidoreductase [Bdellovibrio svalbardensis]MDG0817106.1 FAD-binding oxidoreductase [Bdellovibrio svalbardensis]